MLLLPPLLMELLLGPTATTTAPSIVGAAGELAEGTFWRGTVQCQVLGLYMQAVIMNACLLFRDIILPAGLISCSSFRDPPEK
jgi:hypothetical protein